MVVRDAGEHGARLGELGLDGQADEGLAAVAAAHVGRDGGKRLGLLLGRGLLHPDGRVVRAQVVVAMREVVGKGDERDGLLAVGDAEAAPLAAAVDGALELSPGRRLLDGEADAQLLGLLLEPLERDLS